MSCLFRLLTRAEHIEGMMYKLQSDKNYHQSRFRKQGGKAGTLTMALQVQLAFAGKIVIYREYIAVKHESSLSRVFRSVVYRTSRPI